MGAYLEEIERRFGDFEPVEPGVGYTALWRPDEPVDADDLTPGERLGMAGIARKTGPPSPE